MYGLQTDTHTGSAALLFKHSRHSVLPENMAVTLCTLTLQLIQSQYSFSLVVLVVRGLRKGLLA